jgi:glycolate oxidase
LASQDDRVPFSHDANMLHGGLAKLVVLPGNEEEVAAVLRLLHQLAVPLVTRGAGTGLSGGALADEKSVLLSTARLNHILEIDPQARIARVQPGVRNQAVSDAAAPFGLYYAPDPSSQIACTIGGNIAENSGGIHCLKYGLTVHNVLGLRLVLADGTILTLGTTSLEGPADAFLPLICGSEGLLGVVTEATLRLLPQPESVALIVAAFSSLRHAADAVNAILMAGIVPSALEMMDQLTVTAVERYLHLGYPQNSAAIVLCEVDGDQASVKDDLEQARKVFQKEKAFWLETAEDEVKRLQLWQGRKMALPALVTIAPDYYCLDGAIPRRYLAEVLEAIDDLGKRHGFVVANTFHAGDGNLHPIILFEASTPAVEVQVVHLADEILELLLAYEGTITGEHGVGVEKLGPMCVQFNDIERDFFLRLKEGFDPKSILNPGKAIPTLARCMAYNRMRVQGSRLPFDENLAWF